MISNDSKSAHERDFQEDYYTPEYITCTLSEPQTLEENGKKTHTTYKISTVVSCDSIVYQRLRFLSTKRRSSLFGEDIESLSGYEVT